MTAPGAFNTSFRRDDALHYAEACLKQGMSYQGASLASGVCQSDLRERLPGYGAPPRETPEAEEGSTLARCASILATANPGDVRRVAALALGLVADTSGFPAMRETYNNVALAVSAKAKGVSPRDQIMLMVDGVATEYGLTRDDIISDRRDRQASTARQHVMWMLHKNTALSNPAIGKLLGGRDPTTILHGLRQHEKRMATQ